MDSHEDISFYGWEGEGCEGFIRAVRKVAFAAGKIRNDSWMADFASTCLDGPALRYYETLSPEVQGDWRLLRQALLTRYTIPEDADGAQNGNPSSTRVHSVGGGTPQPRMGRIRVLGENSADFGYIGDGNAVTTSCLGAGATFSDALTFSYTPTGTVYEIEIKRQSGEDQVLGLHWKLPSPSTAVGSPDYAALTAFRNVGTYRSSSMLWEGPGHTKVWKVMPDNTVQPHLRDNDSYIALGVFRDKNSGYQSFAIDAVADPGAFLTAWKAHWGLVRLLFEEMS